MYINVKKETFVKNLGMKYTFVNYEEFISLLKEKAVFDLKSAINTLSGKELSQRIYDIIPYSAEEENFSIKMFFDKNELVDLEPSYILRLIHTGFFYGLVEENTKPVTRKTKENAIRLKYLEKLREKNEDIFKEFGTFLTFIREESNYLPKSFITKRYNNVYLTTYSEIVKEELYQVYNHFFNKAMNRYSFKYRISKKYENKLTKSYFEDLII